MWFLLLGLLKLQSCQGSGDPSEPQEFTATGCESLSLKCPTGTMMMITRASVSSSSSCNVTNPGQIEDSWELWESVVRRCSGYSTGSCLFNPQVEAPDRKEWNRGLVFIRYRCLGNVSSYCGGKIELKREGGTLSSPGYPKYYLGGRECVWTLTARLGQRIKLQLNDISQQGSDCVRLVEGDEVVMEHCGDLSSPQLYNSAGHIVELRMSTAAPQHKVLPRRGLLVSYSPLGCPMPHKIADGQLIEVNQSHARYQCNEGYIFRSEYVTHRTWHCRNNSWVGEVEHCVSLEFLMQYGNTTSLLQALTHHQTRTANHSQARMEEWKMEVGATVLVGVLLVLSLGVGVLLFYRFKEAENLCLQEDEINLRESSSRQTVQDDVERY